ncbi:hypothetical protein XAP412_470090 [Xanthomonas phaseoli pv. phaseoli]|uniref:Transposase n=1 Tax=Xanthomonas campestris pv. phaseoli TaxID=317013 RepID=A0AB38E245_XANCH|nr:hypothetical protein XAP6984_520091 [Xanthomonas phaseoli pv. phaseoli]SON86269.1 hypothetical protein XAP412_470090 [Xanthomonas phaseoli pv. phaseoli]SON90569.1 hypothetical protein XAP7430_480139 [Xanthomonas phaseoli pv. phaseoli]SOO31099.1 hypothetical protein XAP6164_500002 [Xanthomonas phaseoli pv. phaseoli]
MLYMTIMEQTALLARMNQLLGQLEQMAGEILR